ncbi:hypothetical protein FHS57_003489 [Runella defluvii]|uniref:DUF3828 domain-containing protein n=1 Tax=Runella defluvii TaxID=370973 RepID=A0A7W5ZLN0_9BACT|nr:DUF3828 domain-containing protein [Runella defluvii]MBB3839480.1 hypothetical protein [Runella defluvii]
MRRILVLFFVLGYFANTSNGQTKTAAQTVQDFYKWYTTKGAMLEWRQVLKRPEFSPAFRKRLTVFYQKMEKDNEGGYDPIVQAQDFDDQFKIKPISSAATKATFELWMFGGKAATVTLNNVANQWLIDDIKGVQ